MGGNDDSADNEGDDEAKLLRASEPRSAYVLPDRMSALRKQVAALTRALWDSGVACVCTAAVVFSLSAFFVKLMGEDMPVFEIVAVRSVSSFLVCAAYARAAGVAPLFGKRANLKFLLARGLFGAAAMTSYYFSLKLLPLADAVTLFFLNPAVTAIVAWAVLKEPLGGRGVAGVLVSVAGLVLITRPPFLGFSSGSSSSSSSGSSSSAALHGDGGVGVSSSAAAAAAAAATAWDAQRLLGTLFGVLSALLSAGAFISIRFIGKSEPALVMSVYFHLSAAASCAVPLLLGLPQRAVAPSGPQWALLAGVAATSFWGQILIGRGFQLLSAARASAINFTQVVYSYMLGLLFLHESLSLSGGAGSALIATGAVLVNLRPKPPPQTAAAAAAAAATAAGAAGAQTQLAAAGAGADQDGGAGAPKATGDGCAAGADGDEEAALGAAGRGQPGEREGGGCGGGAGGVGPDRCGGGKQVELQAVLVVSGARCGSCGKGGSSCGGCTCGEGGGKLEQKVTVVAGDPGAQPELSSPSSSASGPGPGPGPGPWGYLPAAATADCDEARARRGEEEEAEAEAAASEGASLLRCTVTWRTEGSSSSSAAVVAAPRPLTPSGVVAAAAAISPEAVAEQQQQPQCRSMQLNGCSSDGGQGCSRQAHVGEGARQEEEGEEEERQGLLPARVSPK
ncbi:hypothetical protein HXX76_010527 [Chlamydomonas incerta]|uniref:EamA domain-containing protein n=1 Tax=Chlamydomonas incerta TaxID=51695 RepID=A0A835SMD8_CHLIN|nr:hypothetical protein HXX76_010527 [Chlamydomonas incerta]|eukprot:KAG2429743.1 hypothetical protein HXX76_010527 [Chlamydomonas incerta]